MKKIFQFLEGHEGKIYICALIVCSFIAVKMLLLGHYKEALTEFTLLFFMASFAHENKMKLRAVDAYQDLFNLLKIKAKQAEKVNGMLVVSQIEDENGLNFNIIPKK
jgi:hypothetical protein